jgi:S-adenosylmethionine-diacylglycerol 3-amino-3-carboxypropyl transferase
MTATLVRGAACEAAPAIADGSLRYSSVWEDYRLLERGLAIDESSDVLMIAGAGCNVLNLLLRAPRRIVALDFNPAQTALVELKLAAIRTLSHDDFVHLLGVRPFTDRLELYDRVRPALSAAAQRWWDANVATLEQGIEQSGRLDRYIAEFREHHLSRVHASDAVDRLLSLDDPEARRRFAHDAFFTPAFAAVFRAYFTRESLAGRGRDESQFRYVTDVDVGGWFWQRLQWVATNLPTRGNFYLERFLRGTARDLDAGPPYLRPRNYARLRALSQRVDVVTDTLDGYLAAAPRGTVSAAGLSDVFEYMSSAASDALFSRLAAVLEPGGRIAFWNLFVTRCPSRNAPRFQPRRALSRALWRRDRSWFYRDFHVVEVVA